MCFNTVLHVFCVFAYVGHRTVKSPAAFITMMIIIIRIINYVLNTVCVYTYLCVHNSYVGGVRTYNAAQWILNSTMHAGVACPPW